jgi:hypothetical protein
MWTVRAPWLVKVIERFPCQVFPHICTLHIGSRYLDHAVSVVDGHPPLGLQPRTIPTYDTVKHLNSQHLNSQTKQGKEYKWDYQQLVLGGALPCRKYSSPQMPQNATYHLKLQQINVLPRFWKHWHECRFLEIQQNGRWDICVDCFARLAISHTIKW